MDQRTRQPLLGTRIDITFLPFSFNPLTIELHENVEIMPRVRDLRLPMAFVSPHHKVKFFFPRIEVLFVVKDKVVRIKHTIAEYKVLVWRLGRNSDGEWLWNFEHEEKMQYVRH
jgi:hypothetical protein